MHSREVDRQSRTGLIFILLMMLKQTSRGNVRNASSGFTLSTIILPLYCGVIGFIFAMLFLDRTVSL